MLVGLFFSSWGIVDLDNGVGEGNVVFGVGVNIWVGGFYEECFV